MTPLVAGYRIKAVTAVASSQLSRRFFNSTALNEIRCFSSSKQPPRKKPRGDHSRKGSEALQNNNNNNNNSSNSNTKLRIQSSNRRFKTNRKKDWKNYESSQLTNQVLPVIQTSSYYYHSRRNRTLDETSSTLSAPRLALPVMNASAILDPLSYCKTSAKTAHTHGVNRGISGTDAARRLLRGKKDFLVTARGLRVPALLEGHGVPPQLFQHCIDMGDFFLRKYGEDVVECTFHNYNSASKLPQVIRSRTRNGSTPWPWPPPPDTLGGVDWNHQLTLYLTVMERLACHLGLVFQRKHQHVISSEEDDDDDDFISSPLLFPDSPVYPRWNVDVLRGAYFDLHRIDESSSNDNTNIPPLPIVEFSHGAETTGHVVIRLQGKTLPNQDFSEERSGHLVTLVFDACFVNR